MAIAVPVYLAIAGLASTVSAHVAFWDPSMYGFNVTDNTFPYDNRPQVPLMDMTFDQWWMHGHIGYPPKPGDFFNLPAGGKVNTQLSCDKGATSWYNSSQGGDVGYGDNFVCPGRDPSVIHATGIDDTTGCGLAIAYQSDVHALKPDDFVIFSVNHTCPWYLNTEFEVPNLPPCPEEGCHCAWFWIHSYDSGAEQMYMNGFKCKVTGDAGTQPLGTPALPRRCGPDPEHGNPNGNPGNCTIGAKNPMYWYQKERNNMFEDTYWAPYYNDLYGFKNGAQNDVFQDGVIASLAPVSSSVPSATSTPIPSPTTPIPTTTGDTSNPATTSVETSSSSEQASSPLTPSSSTPTSNPDSIVSSPPTGTAVGSPSACKRAGHAKQSAPAKRHHARHLRGLH